MRRRTGALAIVLAFVAPMIGRADTPVLTFGPRVSVMTAFGEPSIALGPDGAIYISSLAANYHDAVAKSTDGGATWTLTSPVTNTPFGGNDDNVVVAPDNTVYLAGQWIPASTCQSVAVGPAGAAVWLTQPVACKPGLPRVVDRPWLAVSERGAPIDYTLYLFFTDPCCSDNTPEIVMRSDDHGLTWTQAGVASHHGWFPGNIVADDDAGLLYTITTPGSSSVEISISSDRGTTWTQRTVASMQDFGDHGLNHIFLAKDAAGMLYTAWADDGDTTGINIWFASSADHGETWSAPSKVTTSSGTHIYPTIAAGAPGRVAVAWYETDRIGDPNHLAVSTWVPHAAISTNADASDVTWSESPVTAESNHHGLICTTGSNCTTNRNLLDFFDIAIDAEGRANVTWADDRNGARRIYFARSL